MTGRLCESMPALEAARALSGKRDFGVVGGATGVVVVGGGGGVSWGLVRPVARRAIVGIGAVRRKLELDARLMQERSKRKQTLSR
jgi:hypothetical protein